MTNELEIEIDAVLIEADPETGIKKDSVMVGIRNKGSLEWKSVSLHVAKLFPETGV